LRDKEVELVRRNVKVVVVTFENDFLARCYVEDTALAWPILIDTTREVYKGYGMFSASFWDVWGIKTWLVYFKELLKGVKPQKSEGDIYQRGGDVLVDPGGIVRLHHIGRGPADRPSVEQILRVISPLLP
jgi:alkyl hydroperoxide reductase subunit AhpC